MRFFKNKHNYVQSRFENFHLENYFKLFKKKKKDEVSKLTGNCTKQERKCLRRVTDWLYTCMTVYTSIFLPLMNNLYERVEVPWVFTERYFSG